MNPESSTPNREDVLNAFSLEERHNKDVLSEYLRRFPQFALDLIDLSCELFIGLAEDASPLSGTEQAIVDAAWQRHVKADPNVMPDILSKMSVSSQRQVSQVLGVQRQVVTALRERRVRPQTIPESFRRKLAAAMNVSLELITANLAISPQQTPARAYKSDQKPAIGPQVNFEQILIDAGIPEEDRRTLLADED